MTEMTSTSDINSVSLQKVDSDESLISLEVPRKSIKKVNRYYSFLVRFPSVIILGAAILVAICGSVSLHFHPLPDFSQNPSKGFETRGTFIRAAASTVGKLFEQMAGQNYIPNIELAIKNLSIWYKQSSNASSTNSTSNFSSLINRVLQKCTIDQVRFKERKRKREAESESNIDTQSHYTESRSECTPYFQKGMKEAKFVFEAVQSDGDLLSANAIRSLCKLEEQYLRPYFRLHCPLVSITVLVQDIVKKSCIHITDEDTEYVRNLLLDCAPFYYNGSLQEYTSHNIITSHSIPSKCFQKHGYNVVYSIFYYLANIGYLNPTQPHQTGLQSVISYMVYADQIETDWKDFYHSYLEHEMIINDYVKLVAVELPDHEQVKFQLFSEYIYSDMKLFILAALLIIFLMILYLKSVALMVATVLNVISSFILAYFIYTTVLQITFFPFLNVLAILVLIAVGADDVFIFYDTWEQVHRGAGAELPYNVAMARTFRHAALSIFVTSVTTAAAFFANAVSQITVIRCFGIFAGISMLFNFFFMIIWTPSILILSVKVWASVLRSCSNCSSKFFTVHRWFTMFFTKLNHTLFSRILPSLTEKAWPIWIFIFISAGIGSCFVIFINPKLRLPTSKNFQLLDSDSILEKWDSTYRTKFQSIVDSDKDGVGGNMSLYFVWGFQPNYDRFTLNPDEINEQVIEDKSFDFYNDEAQLWSQEFCGRLKASPFISSFYKTKQCQMDKFSELLGKFCDSHYSTFMPACCTRRSPPYSIEQLEVCIPVLMLVNSCSADRTQHLPYGEMEGLLYDRGTNRLNGFISNIPTTMQFSLSYSEMDSNYKMIETFLKDSLVSAPRSLKNGFFAVQQSYSFALFYDLQRAIATGTFYSIGISLGIAFLVMFLATRNILVTFYAIVNIGCVILCTIALIVLLGWDLNILESITMSLGIGLSIDFTIHYGVAYCLSEHRDAKSRTREAFARVGGAVAMSALTTFVAGAAMMPSHVLAYYKLGIFLMIIMSFSWSYSTFMFQSMCRIVGPRGRFCQLNFVSRKAKSQDMMTSEISSINTSVEDGPPVFTGSYVNFVKDHAVVAMNDHHSFSSMAV